MYTINLESPEQFFVYRFLQTAMGTLIFIFLFVALVDPNNTLPLSLPLERIPVTNNQRFGYTSIARDTNFDSLIIGTSTTRMIKPDDINNIFNTKFSNLSLDSGTWWEQGQMFQLFLRHHPNPKMVLWGIDTVWCSPQGLGSRLTPRPFPSWLYDDNPWNNYLYILNFKHIELAGRQIGNVMGIKGVQRFGRDGYASLNRKGVPYDLAKARYNIYGQTTPIPPVKLLKRAAFPLHYLRHKPYPKLQKLQLLLSMLPATTRIVLVMVPYHQHYLGSENAARMLKYQECKRRVFKISKTRQYGYYIDFMFRSNFTSEDSNYWDIMHYNEKGAKIIQNALIDLIVHDKHTSDIYRSKALRDD